MTHVYKFKDRSWTLLSKKPYKKLFSKKIKEAKVISTNEGVFQSGVMVFDPTANGDLMVPFLGQ